MYHKAGSKYLRDPNNFSQISTDFNDFDPVGFWRLGDSLSEVPAVKLGKRKRFHRWGILALLAKRKVLDQAKAPDAALTWETLKWRPLVSAYNNTWKRWFSLAGRTLTLLARVIWPKGCMVTSTREVPSKICLINKKFGNRNGIR